MSDLQKGKQSGFTLLEVMVAVAILGLALTAIFSSEAGAIRMATRTGKMGTGALLARCKMLEIEEKIASEGLPAIFASDTDECCEDAEVEGFKCEWEINLVVLPDSMFAPEGDDEDAAPPAAGGMDIPLGGGGDITEMLGGGGSGFGATAIQMVYPVLKPAFEAQLRRATIKVIWKEGSSEKSFEVTQYVVAEQGVAPEIDPDADLSGAAAGQKTKTGSTE